MKNIPPKTIVQCDCIELMANLDDNSINLVFADPRFDDKRATPHGRRPDDTWILRPRDIPDSFSPNDDTWYFPPGAGIFKRRAGFHGGQMPEQLPDRIIGRGSNPGDRVLDPFSGSGSTRVVARKLDRQFIGYELSQDYVDKIKVRLSAAEIGTKLDGVAEPLTSALPRKKVDN